ncbi:TPA: ferredoxin-type protein NapF [Photobacterium damselae]|uniref:ferredoxin-type protein NapF n=1 Tax=Photobacterium damselae TaxID=38293 RepID=UPI00370B391E
MFDKSRRNLFSRRQAREWARLPWSIAEDEFVDRCTRCKKCITACETQIIAVGDGGFPEVNFQQGEGECTFCYQCADACPESLFLEQKQSPWRNRIDIQNNCIALHNVECRSCGDMCETQAISFQLQVGSCAVPQLDTDKCTGCGACLSTCPVSAITLTAHQSKE